MTSYPSPLIISLSAFRCF